MPLGTLLPSTMWLDELPVEVCERIIRNMLIEWEASTYIYTDIVALSRISDKQKKAAIRALPAHFFYSIIDHPVDGFQELLAPSLQSLSLGRSACPEDELLLQAPHIRSVATSTDSCHTDIMNVVAGSSLRRLELHVSDSTPWEEIVNCLQTLRLSQLVLKYPRYGYWEPDNCPCVPDENSPSDRNERLEAILSALPGLQSLIIRCRSHTPQYADQVVRRVLQLPNIQQINVVSSLSSVPADRLKKLHYVVIDDYTDNQFETALELGSLLTHFFAPGRDLDRVELAQLKNCKSLKSISVALEQGAEVDLGDLVRELPELGSLEVSWPARMTEDEEGLPMRLSYAAFPGAMQRAVEAGKKLFELKICNATVDAFELDQILQSLGEKLLSFTLTISYPSLHGYACLQRCLDGILKYNPSLNKLGIKWQGYEVLQPFQASLKHQGPIRRILKTARCLYVRNMLPRLPYFLMALNGYYRLAFEFLGGIATMDDSWRHLEGEGAEDDEVAMEE